MTTPPSRRSRHPRAARNAADVPWSRCDRWSAGGPSVRRTDQVPAERRAERRERVRARPDDVVDRDVVDAGEVVRRSQGVFRRLHVDGTTAAARRRCSRSRWPTGAPAISTSRRLDPPKSRVPYRGTRRIVARRSDPADVRRLPRLLRERLREPTRADVRAPRSTVAQAVRADGEQGGVDRRQADGAAAAQRVEVERRHVAHVAQVRPVPSTAGRPGVTKRTGAPPAARP